MQEFDPRQMKMITLDSLVSKSHQYRKILTMLNFSYFCKPLKKLNSELRKGGNTGYGITTLFKCIFLQFMEDVSDRELEKFLQENNASKLFCGFNLGDKTPHFSLFTKVRSRIGTSRLSKIFIKIREKLKKSGYILENFTFVDATHLISKHALWKSEIRQ